MATQVQFGDLTLAFTTSFDLMYNDKGSGASMDGAFWQPNPPSGFYALGGVGVNNYNDINNISWALCVQDSSPARDALAFPTSYTLIWNDKNSGANMDGSCWRATPPSGYVALGDIFVTGYNPPALNAMVCVRKDLIETGLVGTEIWNDKRSGASMDIDVFGITVPSIIDLSGTNGLFAANTYVANNSYSVPSYSPVVNCLNLPFPTQVFNDPAIPTLSSTNMPPRISGTTIDRIVTVPFTAILDTAYSTGWKVANSPFYQIDRIVAYQLELFNYNQTSTPQTVSKSVTTGVTNSQSETFSLTTGVSVTAKGGVSFLGTGGEVSATVSIELGFETSTNVEVFTQSTIERSIVTEPNVAAALWALSYELSVTRGDNTTLPESLSFDVDSFVEDQYPK